MSDLRPKAAEAQGAEERFIARVLQGRQKETAAASPQFPMTAKLWAFALLFITTSAASLASDCIQFAEARKHIGDHRCVTGKVLRVEQSTSGATFLDFCEDYRVCPFTVVVFRGDLKHVGDVRQLSGRTIEISGEVKDYDGRAEIILKEARQLKGEAGKIPALPKGYDVEKKGRYSAGKFSHPSSKRKIAHQRQPAPIPTEDPADPSGAPE